MVKNWYVRILDVLQFGLFGVLILGVGGRLVMRLIAILGPVTPGGSLGGSLEVMAFGGLVGLATGVAYQVLKRWLPGSWWLRGLILGAGLYLILLLVPFDSKQAARGFPDQIFIVHLLFATLVLLYGMVCSRFSAS